MFGEEKPVESVAETREGGLGRAEAFETDTFPRTHSKRMRETTFDDLGNTLMSVPAEEGLEPRAGKFEKEDRLSEMAAKDQLSPGVAHLLTTQLHMITYSQPGKWPIKVQVTTGRKNTRRRRYILTYKQKVSVPPSHPLSKV